MNPNVFEDPVLLWLGPVPVTETMATSTVITLGLLAIALAAREAIRRRPRHWLAVFALTLVQWFDDQVCEIVGEPHSTVATLVGSLFLFIAGCNIAGQLPGAHPATGNIATTSALACVVFLAVPVAGVRALGLWGYARRYVQPNPLLLPLHIISELSRTLALSVRLFGNIMSGHLVVGILVALAGFLVPAPLMALDLLIGLLQAYIFAILATVYIGAAMHAEDA